MASGPEGMHLGFIEVGIAIVAAHQVLKALVSILSRDIGGGFRWSKLIAIGTAVDKGSSSGVDVRQLIASCSRRGFPLSPLAETSAVELLVTIVDLNGIAGVPLGLRSRLSSSALLGGTLVARAGSTRAGIVLWSRGPASTSAWLRDMAGAGAVIRSASAHLVGLAANSAEAVLNGGLSSALAVHLCDAGIVELLSLVRWDIYII